MTPRQLQALTFIRYHMTETGMAPTYLEIATALETNKSSAFAIVCGLEKRGIIRLHRKRARAIELVDPKPYRDLLGAGLATSVECHALAEGIEPETFIKECVRERLELP